eukprot:TRINITY_DN2615_c0_g1_i1.p1 TRINITY_DN2615_c0_g1~~TRINITY_DN2615_c0_g1_i1.p1  ORF type:complete len:138 (-),score=32.39 TRINITY_DN2615_c0_g1_i1:356-769(-)
MAGRMSKEEQIAFLREEVAEARRRNQLLRAHRALAVKKKKENAVHLNTVASEIAAGAHVEQVTIQPPAAATAATPGAPTAAGWGALMGTRPENNPGFEPPPPVAGYPCSYPGGAAPGYGVDGDLTRGGNGGAPDGSS